MNRRGMRRPLAALAGLALGVTLVPMTAVGSTAATASELYFSEYVEGSSNNKALEIFNDTGAPVDLAAAGYKVQMFFNGNAAAGLTVDLVGTVAPGDVFVLAQSAANAAILAQADQMSSANWFNGDDAIVLRKGAEVVDVIGQVGFDPGTQWGTGDASTADNTLRRKDTVTEGDTNGGDAFDPNLEWDGYPNDTFDGLGAHGGAGPVDEPPTVTATVPVDGATDVAVTQSQTVTFSEDVLTSADAFTLTCAGELVAATVTGTGASRTVDPDGSLPSDATCNLTVNAAGVTDRDGEPDQLQGDHVVGFSTASRSAVCDTGYTPAYEIQGSGATSPLSGSVFTSGVVVGDYEGASPALRGFYLQDLTGDGDPGTSDALFVFNNNDTEVSLGDIVRVTGSVSEFQGQTQVSARGDGVVVCDESASVAPTEVQLPFSSEADRERYEGMLVNLTQTLTVTELFQLGRFGQVTLSSGGKLAQPTNVVEPGAEASALQAANDLNRIVVDDALNNQNPDPIAFGRDGQPLSAANTLRGGDTATGTVGVMTYTWAGNSASPNNYRVRPLRALGGHVEFEAANPRPESPEPVGGDVQVASFNVLNYFNSFTGCRAGCRGANNLAEFERQADKIVAALAEMDADVVGLIEIENDGYAPESAIADLTRRLNEVVGAGTYDYVDVDARTGQTDALGDDAIKVGLLYKPAVVDLVGQTAALNSEEFVTGGDSGPRNRPALAQAFEDRDGGRFTVVVNHLKSKGSACDAPDAGDGQANCNAVRTRAAQLLAGWLATDPTGSSDTDALIVGDLNSYAKEDPIDVLKEAGYKDLVRRYEGKDAYSYVFDGQWGYLDHALASPHLARQVTGATTWHINADEPTVLDYNTEFKSAAQVAGLYAPTPYRSSDHDPVLVGLDLAPSKPGADGLGS